MKLIPHRPRERRTTRKPLWTWNRLNLALSNLIAAALSLSGPQFVDCSWLSVLQALDQAVGQPRTRLAWQRERLFLNFIQGSSP